MDRGVFIGPFTGEERRKCRFSKGLILKWSKNQKSGTAILAEGKNTEPSPDVRSRDKANWILTCSKITELDLDGGSTCARVGGTSLVWLYFFRSAPVPVILQYVHGPPCQHSHSPPESTPSLSLSQYCCSHRRGRESLGVGGRRRCPAARLKHSSGENEIVRWPQSRHFIVYARTGHPRS